MRNASSRWYPLVTILPSTSAAARPSASRPETASSRSLAESRGSLVGRLSVVVKAPLRQAVRRPEVSAPVNDSPRSCWTASM